MTAHLNCSVGSLCRVTFNFIKDFPSDKDSISHVVLREHAWRMAEAGRIAYILPIASITVSVPVGFADKNGVRVIVWSDPTVVWSPSGIERYFNKVPRFAVSPPPEMEEIFASQWRHFATYWWSVPEENQRKLHDADIVERGAWVLESTLSRLQ